MNPNTGSLASAAFDIQRLVEFDFLRATEMAALNCMQWMGKGNKEAADAAACDAIRGMFDIMDIRGEVVIGEGIKDEAPGLFRGERVGMWREGSPRFDIALDPVDGTTMASVCTSTLCSIAGRPRMIARACSRTTCAPSKSNAAEMMSCGGGPVRRRHSPTTAPPKLFPFPRGTDTPASWY